MADSIQQLVVALNDQKESSVLRWERKWPTVRMETAEACMHEMVDSNGTVHALRSELPIDIFEGNRVENNKVDSMISSLDDTLWQCNMRGWDSI